MPCPVDPTQLPGRKTGTIGPANRVGNIEAIKPHAMIRHGINIRGLNDSIAITPQMVSTMLVRHENDEVGTFFRPQRSFT